MQLDRLISDSLPTWLEQSHHDCNRYQPSCEAFSARPLWDLWIFLKITQKHFQLCWIRYQPSWIRFQPSWIRFQLCWKHSQFLFWLSLGRASCGAAKTCENNQKHFQPSWNRFKSYWNNPIMIVSVANPLGSIFRRSSCATATWGLVNFCNLDGQIPT